MNWKELQRQAKEMSEKMLGKIKAELRWLISPQWWREDVGEYEVMCKACMRYSFSFDIQHATGCEVLARRE